MSPESARVINNVLHGLSAEDRIVALLANFILDGLSFETVTRLIAATSIIACRLPEMERFAVSEILRDCADRAEKPMVRRVPVKIK